MSEQAKPATRFIIEGEWSGYTSNQQRVVHRVVYPASRKELKAWASSTYGIRYTDGTMLYLRVRDCKPREKVQVIRGYVDLINDCFHYKVTSVSDLSKAREKAKEEAIERQARL